MRYLADPDLVRWSAGASIFVVFLAVVLPLAAFRQHRALGADPRATRMEIYAGAVATHALLLALVWLAMRAQAFSLLPPYRFVAWHGVVGLIALAIGLLPLLERLGLTDADTLRRTRQIAPRSRGEHALFYGVALSAAVTEELAYRGLLFVFLAALTGSWWAAAVIAAMLFGVVHLFQGWKGAGIASLMGLREHIVVGLTGTLVIAMVVHLLHDIIAGTVVGRRARREEAPVAVS